MSGEGMVPIPNFKKPKDMNKQYTTEEIIEIIEQGNTLIYAKSTPKLSDGTPILKIGEVYQISKIENNLIYFRVDGEMKAFGIEYFNKLFGFSKKNQIKEEPPIPEWLQRERMAHWSRCYANCLGSQNIDRYVFANKSLKDFDIKFLNKEN